MVRINDVYHSDIYITPDKLMFVPDTRSEFGLVQLEPEDFDEFYALLENTYKGRSSYSVI